MIETDPSRRGAHPRRREKPRPSREPVGSPGSRHRLSEFDALRATAILLVVTLHSALAYTRLDIPRLLWGVREPSVHRGFDLFSWWAMGVSVPLFFAISGFFAAEVEQSRGPSAFLRSRVRRVIVPMLAAGPILLPLCFFAWTLGWLATGRCTFHEFRRMRFLDPAIMSDLYGPAHLWFLLYLAPMLLGFGWLRRSKLDRDEAREKIRVDLASKKNRIRAARGLRRKKVRFDRSTAEDEPQAWRWLLAPWAPIALAIPSIILMRIGREVAGVDLSLDRHNSFFPNLIRLAHYGTFFAIGIGLHRVRDGLGILAARGWWILAASVPVFAYRARLLPRDWSGTMSGTESWALALTGALFSWLAVFGLIGVYRRHCARRSQVIRYLAEASFWLYLAHMPVVGLIQAALVPTQAPTTLKFAFTLSATLALGLASYHVLVRGTKLGRFLGGGKGRAVTPSRDRRASSPAP
ncbi:acyltransferase family protein [Tundrisphaera lichenicola]|uniref:acyltransferase family protein n=1 Tax=Tundrisphaera lichenicola TaxID=2029860 RepID=UPI003EB82F2F